MREMARWLEHIKRFSISSLAASSKVAAVNNCVLLRVGVIPRAQALLHESTALVEGASGRIGGANFQQNRLGALLPSLPE